MVRKRVSVSQNYPNKYQLFTFNWPIFLMMQSYKSAKSAKKR